MKILIDFSMYIYSYCNKKFNQWIGIDLKPNEIHPSNTTTQKASTNLKPNPKQAQIDGLERAVIFSIFTEEVWNK